MGVGKGGNRNPPFRLAFAYFRPVESRPPEGGPPRKGNLLSDHTELLCEKRKSVCCRLRRRLPPGGPFLNDQKGAKESVKEGDSDFPLLDNPPLKTANQGGASSGQSPHRSPRPGGQVSLRSLAPPLPNEPASLGFVWVPVSPLLDVPPEPSYRKAPCAVGLRCNAAGAPSPAEHPHMLFTMDEGRLEMPSRDVCPVQSCCRGGSRDRSMG